MTSVLRPLGVALAAVLLVACGGDDGGTLSTGDPVGEPADGGGALAGEYVSVGVTEAGEARPLVEGTEIQLRFHGSTVGASLGCNSMSGTYQLDGDVLVVGDGLAMTEMGCDPPRHDQDQWFADLLGSRPTATVDGQELTLTSGDTVVRFVDRDVAEPDIDLVGTTWAVDGFADGEDPEDSATSTAAGEPGVVRFQEDGFVTGSDGCNGFGQGDPADDAQIGLQYEVEGDRITFVGEPPRTLRACRDDLTDDVERFWAVLTGTATWTVDGDALTLVGQDGRVMTLRARR